MIADYKNSRLYREIMREAVLLGDKWLMEIVLARLADLQTSSMPRNPKSNVIPFPGEPLAPASECRAPENLWMTLLLSATIPLAIALFVLAINYFNAFCPLPYLR